MVVFFIQTYNEAGNEWMPNSKQRTLRALCKYSSLIAYHTLRTIVKHTEDLRIDHRLSFIETMPRKSTVAANIFNKAAKIQFSSGVNSNKFIEIIYIYSFFYGNCMRFELKPNLTNGFRTLIYKYYYKSKCKGHGSLIAIIQHTKNEESDYYYILIWNKLYMQCAELCRCHIVYGCLLLVPFEFEDSDGE